MICKKQYDVVNIFFMRNFIYLFIFFYCSYEYVTRNEKSLGFFVSRQIHERRIINNANYFIFFCISEYVAGGELFRHLGQHEKFSENTVRIYIGEIILALERLHQVCNDRRVLRLSYSIIEITINLISKSEFN